MAECEGLTQALDCLLLVETLEWLVLGANSVCQVSLVQVWRRCVSLVLFCLLLRRLCLEVV